MPIDPEEFKTRDAASYDTVADRFDYWTERVTSRLAQALVEHAQIRKGNCVLDVGTGSGVVALAAARSGLAGEICGVDLSEGMLRIARSKLPRQTILQFRQMDAEHLECSDGSFDVVVSLFALLHFPHPELAVREMFRVLKPGGRVAIGIGSGAGFSWASAASFWTRHNLTAPKALDRFVTARLPQAATHETSRAAKPPSVNRLLMNAGFRDTRRRSESYTHQIETAEEFWDLQTTFSSVVRKRLEVVPKKVVETLRADFLAKCNAVLERGGRLVYRNGALILSAVRP